MKDLGLKELGIEVRGQVRAMLKMVEYGILAASLLTILGLIISNSRSRPMLEETTPVAPEAADKPGAAPLGSTKHP